MVSNWIPQATAALSTVKFTTSAMPQTQQLENVGYRMRGTIWEKLYQMLFVRLMKQITTRYTNYTFISKTNSQILLGMQNIIIWKQSQTTPKTKLFLDSRDFFLNFENNIKNEITTHLLKIFTFWWLFSTRVKGYTYVFCNQFHGDLIMGYALH